ncbi:ferric reductase like transmembrane component-domain-containing protein [Talaromyces proteolyticus]|uniref:Ferric reductase like transmembrane component-domain-containing protein n=1 Tax=Talaromyces proteolyticus TaxID=1131652 RepID=A0AAD4KHI7_9EURO|nr:ferric reductase like transmembrane component-domain-containing protein [Talaromyces proteolyticus]KAH8692602.1 ferric reductase like transmembrane component-domain-containing protein [Talaromyces proteolyticus]
MERTHSKSTSNRNHSGHNRNPESTMDIVLVYVPIMALLGLTIVLFIYRLWSDLLNRQRLHLALHYPCQNPLSQPSYIKAKLNRHLIYAPLFNRRHNREFRICRRRVHMGTIPTRLETLLIFSYVVLNVVFCLITIDRSKGLATSLHRLSSTSGTLAVVNLVPLVITAARNNPLIPLLRLPFDTFNLVHRWLGRTIVAEAIIHTLAVILNMGQKRGWQMVPHTLFNIPFYIFGFVATASFLVILLHSLSPFRHAFYEFFLHSHIVLAIASFVGLWHHLAHFMQRWIFLAALIAWGIDRMFRLGTVLWKNCGKRLTKANIQLLPGDVARVDVSATRPGNFTAGQFMFLYIPALGLWTSHPFSAAWKSVKRPRSFHSEKSNDSFKTLLGGNSIGQEGTTVSFLIRKKGGFTKKMMKSLGTAHGRKINVLALAEGPYEAGGVHSYDSYGTTLLIAGGIGITHPISYLRELVNGFTNRSVATRRITLLWVVRSIDHLQWVQPWMNYILNHPALQGAVTFSSRSTNPRDPGYFVDDDAYFQQTLSLSIHVHLTSYYSSDTNFTSNPVDSGSADCSSLLSHDEDNSNADFDPIDASVFSENISLPSHRSISSLSSSYRYSYPSNPDDLSNRPSLTSLINDYNHHHDEYNNNQSSKTTYGRNNINDYSNCYNHYDHAKSLKTQDWTKLTTAPITISLGKPLFRQLLEREMAQQVGAMAVSVCGPGGMSDEVRKAVREVQGRKAVDLFEESFSW